MFNYNQNPAKCYSNTQVPGVHKTVGILNVEPFINGYRQY